jgi:hypothetical protein
MNSNGLDELIWKVYSTYSGILCERTYYKKNYKPRKQQKMEESKGKYVVKIL